MYNKMTAAEFIILVNDHFDEIYAVWDEMANEGKDDTTLIIAAEEWLRRTKKQFTASRRESPYFRRKFDRLASEASVKNDQTSLG